MTIQELIESLTFRVVFITQVDMDSDMCIEKVNVKYFAEQRQKSIQLRRRDVISLLDNEILILTAGGNSKDVDFAEVLGYPENNPKFIKTKPNDELHDNLGNLPRIPR